MVDTGDNPKIAFVVVSRGWLERLRGTGWEVSSMPTLAVVLLLVVAQQNWPQNWLKKPVAVQKWWSAKVSEKTIENLREKRKKNMKMASKNGWEVSENRWKSLEKHKVIDSAQAWQFFLSCIRKLNGCHAISCHDFHGQCILQATT